MKRPDAAAIRHPLAQRRSRRGVRTLVPLLLLVLAVLPFWHALLDSSRIAVSADIVGAVSVPWNTAISAQNRPLNGLQGDVVFLLLPWRVFVRDAFAAGRFPLWNPYALGGMSLLGNAQSAMLAPLNLATLPLPLTTGWAVLAIAKRFFAGLGMYCYVRALSTRRLPACFAAIAFMDCASIVDWLHWPLVTVALCLPWLFFALERLLTAATARDRAGWALFLAGVTATHLLGGHPETSVHLSLVALAYAVFRALSLHRRTRQAAGMLLLVAGATVLGIALAAVQLLPALATIRESAAFSQRSTGVAYRLPVEYVQSWGVPFLWGSSIFPAPGIEWGVWNANETTGYVGVPTLVLAVLALRFGWRHPARGGLTRFFVALIVGLAFLVYNLPLSDLLARLPLLQVTLNIRLMLVIGFALTVLAALGFDALLDAASPRPERTGWWAIAIATAFVVAASVVEPAWVIAAFQKLAPFRTAPDHRAWALLWTAVALLWLGLTLAALWQLTRRRAGAWSGSIALLLVLLADLTLFGAHQNPETDAALLFPQTAAISRLRMEVGDARIAGTLDALRPNAATALQIRDLRGYEPTASTAVARYLRAAHLPDAANGQPDGPPDIPLLAAAGIRYYVSPYDRPAFTQEGDSIEATPLVAGREETQWFVAPVDDLSAVELTVTPIGAAPAPLVATISDHTGRVLGRDSQQPCGVATGCPVRFALPAPLAHSAGERYAITLTAPTATNDTAVSLHYAPYAQGSQVTAEWQVGDATVPGALHFRLFVSPGVGMEEAWTAEGMSVWRVPGARPRAYFAGVQSVVPDPDLALLVLHSVATTAEGVVVPQPVPAVPIAGGTATITRDLPGDITIRAEQMEGNGLLVLNEAADPGWRASVDGQTAQVFTVNGIAQGVVVPSGAHTVQFRYLPAAFVTGATVSGAAGVLGLALLGIWCMTRRRTAAVLLPLPRPLR